MLAQASYARNRGLNRPSASMSTYAYAAPSAAHVRAPLPMVVCRAAFLCLIYVPVLVCGWMYIMTTLPLEFISPEWYYAVLRLGRKVFTSTLIFTFSVLSNTEFVFSVSGPDGRLLQASEFTELDAHGRLQRLILPKKGVWIANHQIYTDWVYMWLLSWDAQLDRHLYIVLKKSLEKVPLAGTAMRSFGFIFLSRNWAEDSENMTVALHRVNQRSPKELALVIFPEGTNLTAKSAKAAQEFAARAGVVCPRHILLPRSKGLRFCLSKLYEDDKNIFLLVRSPCALLCLLTCPKGLLYRVRRGRPARHGLGLLHHPVSAPARCFTSKSPRAL